MSSGINKKNHYINLLLNPVYSFKKNEPTEKKVGFFILSVLLGITTLFIPHAINYFYNRHVKVIGLKQNLPTVTKTDKIGIGTFSQRPDSLKPNPTIQPPPISPSERPPIQNPINDDVIYPEEGPNLFQPPQISPPESPPIRNLINEDLLSSARSKEKLPFQILASSFGLNSALEGANPSVLLQYSKQIIEKRLNTIDPELRGIYEFLNLQVEIALNLSSQTSLSNYENCFLNEVDYAKRNKSSFLFSAGWNTKTGGHAIYHELIPDGTFWTLRTHNVGDGSANHGNIENRVLNSIDWKGIAHEKVNGIYFCRILWELNHLKDFDYSQDYIYIFLKAYLAPKETIYAKGSDNNVYLSLKQIIGNCTYKSLFTGFFKTYLPLSEYKQLVCEAKIENAVDTVSNYMTTSLTAQGRYNFQKKSIKAALAYVDKQVYQIRVPKELLAVARAVLQKASDGLISPKPLVNRVFIPSYIPMTRKINLPLQRKEVLNPQASFPMHSTAFTTSSIFLVNSIKKICKPQLAIDTLRDLHGYINKSNVWLKEASALQQALTLFFNRIDYHQDFSSFSNETAKEAIKLLGNIANIHTNSLASVESASSRHPDRVFVLQSICFLQNKLSSICYPKHSSPIFSVYDPEPTENINGMWFGACDASLREKQSFFYKNSRKKDENSIEFNFGGITFVLDDEKAPKNTLKLILESYYCEFYKKNQKSTDEETIFSCLLDENLPLEILSQFEVSYLLNCAFKQLDNELNFNITEGVLDHPKILPHTGHGVLIRHTLFNYSNPSKDPFFLHFEEEVFEKLYKDLILNKKPPLHEQYFNAEKIELTDHLSSIDRHSFVRIFSDHSHTFNDLLALIHEQPNRFKSKDFRNLFLQRIQSHPFHLLDNQGSALYQLYQLESELINLQSDLFEEGTSSIPIILFLNRVLRYSNLMIPGDGDRPVPVFQPLEILEKVIEKSRDEYKELISAEYLLILGLKDLLIEEECRLFLQHSVYLNEHPLNLTMSDPFINFEIEQFRLKHSEQILNWTKEHTDQINSLLDLPSSLSWKSDTKDGLFTSSNQDYFFPITGIYISHDGIKADTIPFLILNSSFFKLLFPEVKTCTSIVDPISQEKTYQFFDQKTNRQTEVLETGQIYQEIDTHGWCSLVIEGEIPKDIPLTLIDRHFIWINFSQTKLLFENRSDRSIKYESEIIDGHIQNLHDNSEWLNLTSSLFSCIESKDFIEEWYDNVSDLIRIDLPRLQLTFSPNINDQSSLICKEFPDFSIDTTKPQPYLIPGFNFGIVLNTSKGKKFLLPRLEFQKLQKYEVLNPNFNTTFCKAYYLYDLDIKNKPIPKSFEAEIYLSCVYLMTQNYAEALKNLRHLRGNLYAFNENNRILHDLITMSQLEKMTGDTDPNAQFIVAFVRWQIDQNKKIYGLKRSEELTVLEPYIQALKKIHHVTFFPFTKEEEIALISLFDPRLKSHVLRDRLHFLSGTPRKNEAVRIHLKAETEPINFSSIAENRDIFDSFWYTIQENLDTNVGITQPGFTKNFYNNYRLALEGTPDEKKWLSVASYFDESKPQALGQLILLVLNNPKEFQLFNPSADSNKWIEATDFLVTVTKTAQNLYKNLKKPEQKPISYTFPLAYYPTLPMSENPLAGITVTFQCEQPIPLAYKEIKNCFEDKPAPQLNIQKLNNYLHDLFDANNRAVIKEKKHLIDDLNFFVTQETLPIYTLTKPDELKELLRDDSSLDEKIANLEHSILEKSNIRPSDLEIKEAYDLRELQGLLKEITLDIVIVAFATQSPEKLQRLNPALNPKNLSSIFESVSEYLLLSTKKQQIDKANKIIEQLEIESKKERPIQILIEQNTQTLASIILSERAYEFSPDNKQTCAFLALEFYANILIRPEQIKTISDFLDSKKPHLIKELIMGSGKSKVLMLLLALLRANGKNISTLVVVPQFFKDVATHTQEGILKSFGQTLKTIHIDRSTDLSPDFIKLMIADLRSIQANKDCLIVTSKTLHMILLRYVNMWANANQTQTQNTELFDLFDELVRILTRETDLLLDEIDTLLNLLRVISISLGKKRKLESHHLICATEIYKILVSDVEIRDLFALECDAFKNENAAFLNVTQYNLVLRKTLAEKFLNILPTLDFKDHKFKFSFTFDEKKLLVDFICQDASLSSQEKLNANVFYKSLTPERKTIIAFVALEIGHILKTTLTSPWNEKYGIPEGGRFAIPYSGANSPNIGSQYLPLIETNYTIQSYLKTGFKEDLVIEIFKQEMATMSEEKKSHQQVIQKTRFNKWKNKFPGIDFEKLSSKDQQTITTLINLNASNRLEFTCDYILPMLEYEETKCTSTPLNLMGLVGKNKSGFSGTLWNDPTYHRDLIAQKEQGTDSKTLALLVTHSDKEATIITDTNPKAFIKALKKKKLEFGMICDAGALLKQTDIEHAAKIIAKALKNNVLFYYQNAQTVTDGQKLIPISSYQGDPLDLTILLDQVNTTGADTQKPLNTVAIVTIKQQMLLRDLLQAVWRLRGLDKGQSVEWVLTVEVADLIRTSLKLDPKASIHFQHILNYCILNTGEELSRQNITACIGQFIEVAQTLIFQTFLSSLSFADKLKHQSLLKELWLIDETFIPEKIINAIPEEEDSLKKLSDLYAEYTKFIEANFLDHPECPKALDELKKIFNIYSEPGMLPKKWTTSSTLSADLEVEKAVEVETVISVVKETENEKVRALTLYFSGSTLQEVNSQYFTSEDQIPFISLVNFCNFFKNFDVNLMQKAFSDIAFSLNFASNITYNRNNLDQYKLYDIYQNQFDYVCFENSKLILLCQKDAHGLLKNDNSRIYSLKSDHFITKHNPKLSGLESQQIMKAKFLGGFSNYDKNEQEMIQSHWILDNKENISSLKNFLEKTILPSFPSKQEQYKESRLFHLLEGNAPI